MKTNYRDSALIAALTKDVIVQVEQATHAGWNPRNISVEYVNDNDYVAIYFAKIKLPRLNVDAAKTLLEQLEVFCHNKDAAIDPTGGERTFLLGDGDDGDAVWLENGVVYIWLRHWPKGM